MDKLQIMGWHCSKKRLNGRIPFHYMSVYGGPLSQLRHIWEQEATRKAGALVPLQRALTVGFGLTTSTNQWRRRLCAGILQKQKKPLLIRKITCLAHMLPAVAADIEKNSRNLLLASAEEACSLKQVTEHTPLKSFLKVQYADLAEEAEATK